MIKIEGLEQAIKEFNEWNRGAMIFYNKNEKYCGVETFRNDVQRAETFTSPGVYSVYEKNERAGKEKNIGEKRKQFIIDKIALFEKGYDRDEAIYELMKTYPLNYLD